MKVNGSIFKAYDIRGVVGSTLDVALAEHLGRAFGTEALRLGEKAVAVGRDGRLSGPSLAAALARGLLASGIDAIDLGATTTPMVSPTAVSYFVNGSFGILGITASSLRCMPPTRLGSVAPALMLLMGD